MRGTADMGKALRNDKFPSSVSLRSPASPRGSLVDKPRRAYELQTLAVQQESAAAALRGDGVDRRECRSLGVTSFIFTRRFSLASTAAFRKLADGKFLA